MDAHLFEKIFFPKEKSLSLFGVCLHLCYRLLLQKEPVVVAELKVVLKLITLGVKFQECAAHSNKSNNSKLTLERNLFIVITAKR